MRDGTLRQAHVANDVIAAITAHAERERPRECCGVLLGHDDAIVDAVAVRNTAESADRFFLDPKGHLDARRHGRARGLAVAGFYHSHPHSTPFPSRTDLAEAAYEGLVHLIVGREDGQWKTRAFLLNDEGARELTLTIG